MDLRKNLIIIIFLLSAVILVLLFLNLNKSWREQSAQIFEEQVNTQTGSLKSNSPKRISKGAVKFFDLVKPDKIIFYDESDSMIYETSFDGRNKKEIARIPNISEVIFSPTGKSLIAAISTSQMIRKFYFDLENNKKVELSRDIGSVAWAPNGSRIAYHFYDSDSDEGNISIANPDGSDFKIILRTRIKDLEIFWPEADSVVFYSKKDSGPMFSVSGETGKLQKLSSSFPYPKFSNEKLSPLNDYSVFINSEDGKLYSLLK